MVLPSATGIQTPLDVAVPEVEGRTSSPSEAGLPQPAGDAALAVGVFPAASEQSASRRSGISKQGYRSVYFPYGYDDQGLG